MNEPTIRRFCESPHRKLIIAIVTALLGLLVLIPLVDDYFVNRESHNKLAEDLGRARGMAERLPAIELEVANLAEKLTEVEMRSISGDSLGEYRNKVVSLVNDSGCRVRQFEVGTSHFRPWLKEDDPLSALKASKDAKKGKTPFTLERRNVVLLVDGSMEGLQKLLGQLHEDDSMAYLHRLELQPTSRESGKVTLHIELWLFALSRLKA